MNTSMVDANHHVGKGNEGKNMSMKFIDLIVYDHIKQKIACCNKRVKLGSLKVGLNNNKIEFFSLWKNLVAEKNNAYYEKS